MTDYQEEVRTESGAMLMEVILASGLVIISGVLALSSVQRTVASTRRHLEHVKPQCSEPTCSMGESIARCLCGKRSSLVIR